ncbi:DUF1937 family protein [Halodesulfovibrio sp.]|uniref:DUF1937 family protein n=1 Tax=Halodesulfovibrio sp. TaxID=1912772 RepID=UPI0025F74709|nr:DUF1937 family protein [Halodesulfovibrio sp.]MCT4625640.1 DUF1937 family protein [Halodesulfovibrio sp.]
MLKVFIACPYNQSDKSICYEQFAASTQVACALIKRNIAAYSPVTHNHSITAQQSESCVPSSVWKSLRMQTLSFHSWADALFVVDLPDVQECAAIQEDIALFRKAEKPVRFIDPNIFESQLDTLLDELMRSDSSRL